MNKTQWKLTLTGVAVLFVGLLGAATFQEKKDRPESLEDKIRLLETKIENLERNGEVLRGEAQTNGRQAGMNKTAIETLKTAAEKARGGLQDELNEKVQKLGQYNPPVGTVMAYAGQWPPKGAGTRKKWEETVGWALCDGASFDGAKHEELRNVLGGTNVPDYRGLFLRGVDPAGKYDRDRPANDRVAGSLQRDAVGPHVHNVTVVGGNHSHTFSYVTLVQGQRDDDDDGGPSAYVRPNQTQTRTGRTAPSGNLSMSGTTANNTGHGSETRPKNRAVHFIIKLK